MHANNDSLSVRSASVSGSDAEGRPFEVRQSARPTFFIWPHLIVGTTLRSCREVIAVPVDKIAWRCKQATESAGVSWDLGCRECSPHESDRCHRLRATDPGWSR